MHKKTISILVCVAFLLGVGAYLYSNGMVRSVLSLILPPPSVGKGDTPFPNLEVPEGFTFSVFAEGIPGARVLTLDSTGHLLVSSPSEGAVFALMPDADGDGKSDGVVPVLEGLNAPHGIAFAHNYLYVAEVNAVSRYQYSTSEAKIIGQKEVLFSLPSGKDFRHTTRSLLIIPNPDATDGATQEKLLTSVGSSCDVCEEDDPHLAAVLISDLDGKNLRVFAKGLRNSVFMTLQPVTGQIFATEMGRDWLGDNLPPDEINILAQDGNYGWPICYGNNMHDTEFDTKTYIRNPCMEPFELPSHIDLPAHSAPLGIAFVPEEGWPEEWWHNALVAYHGSWNRSVPTGYKIVRIPLSPLGGKAGQPVDLITGFIDEEKGAVYGRPVDIKLFPGGVGYITDDRAGVVYRLSRTQ